MPGSDVSLAFPTNIYYIAPRCLILAASEHLALLACCWTKFHLPCTALEYVYVGSMSRFRTASRMNIWPVACVPLLLLMSR